MDDGAIDVTPWQVLGIPPGAPRADAERAYRRRMTRAHPDAGGTTAEAMALNRAIAWVRARPRAAPSAGMARPPTAPTPRAPAPSAPAWQRPEPTAGITTRGRRMSRGRSTWLATIALALVGLVLIIANWQAILLAIATLLAITIILSALRE